MLKYQTHLDEYSDEIIQTTDKPSVRDRLYNLNLLGKSVQDGTPTPDNPVTIQNVPSEFDITACGKNLYNKELPYVAKSYAATDENYNNGKKIIANATNKNLRCNYYIGLSTALKGKRITVTADCIPAPNQRAQINIWAMRQENPSIEYESIIAVGYLSVGQSGKLTVTADITENIGYNLVAIALWASPTANPEIGDYSIYDNIMVSIDDSTDYVPYQGAEQTIQIKDNRGLGADSLHELCSLPDGTADEVDWDNSLLHLYMEQKVLNGTESWRREGHNAVNREHTFVINMPLAAQPLNNTSGHTKSTHFKDVMYNDVYANSSKDHCISLTGAVRRLYISSSVFNSFPVETAVADFKTWLAEQYNAGTPVTVIYKLATPQVYDLHPDEIAKLKQLKSVYPQTTIFTSAEVQPTISCSVRKLGNRPFIESPIIDENGDYLVDENGNNIIGVI